ncbi:hypothetical protein D9V87_07475 [Bacteroidetes/Chlorobi group bacterium MS-B_bin-24]|jgi:hypothetical protein|nr:MAG: hypothetical protein D9V87_07475 [Bacteroidetes/Chlorobi group bacterium MS-B_bin-24]
MKFVWVLLSIVFVFSGCVKKDIEKNYYEKFDAKLKLMMKDPQYSKTGQPIRCVIEMYKNMDYILKDKFENVGLKVVTTAGNIIIVEGSVESLYKASRFDFVHRISLSHDYQKK